jgi:hypothetical protein
VSLANFATGVLAFECARSSFTSALVYSRRTIFFFLADFAIGVPFLRTASYGGDQEICKAAPPQPFIVPRAIKLEKKIESAQSVSRTFTESFSDISACTVVVIT